MKAGSYARKAVASCFFDEMNHCVGKLVIFRKMINVNWSDL